jgi:hypothetical protein
MIFHKKILKKFGVFCKSDKRLKESSGNTIKNFHKSSPFTLNLLLDQKISNKNIFSLDL